MNEKLLVPDIGEFENVEVIELLVKPGDQVNINKPVITNERDKSSIEIPAKISGKVKSDKVKVGDKVSKGDLILTTLSTDNSVKEIIPKSTESIIKQAENVISKKNDSLSLEKKSIENKQSKTQIINNNDIDPLETRDWIDSLSAVIEKDGNKRAHFLIKELINKAYREGANIPYTQNTPYINTIPPEAEIKSNGDQNIERRIRSLIRWNAAAMVVRANKNLQS